MAITKNPSTVTVAVGLPSGITTTGVLYRDSVTHSGGSDSIEPIFDEDNEAGVVLLSQDSDEYTIGAIKTTASEVPRKGVVVTINTAKYMVMDSSTQYSRTQATTSVRVKKWTALTFS